jgi:hypothetical protein
MESELEQELGDIQEVKQLRPEAQDKDGYTRIKINSGGSEQREETANRLQERLHKGIMINGEYRNVVVDRVSNGSLRRALGTDFIIYVENASDGAAPSDFYGPDAGR